MADAALDATLVQRHGVPPHEREFEIEGADGEIQTGTNGRVSLTVQPDGKPSRMRKRNAIKNAATPRAHKVQWLYGELDGVRCYLRDDDDGVHVVMTRADLYP